MTYRYTALLGPALLFALVSCGGSGSPGVTDSDKTDLQDDTNGDIQSDKPPIVDVVTKPFLTDEGAEEGLKGCLNRPLYFNGPHTVSIRNAVYSYDPFYIDHPTISPSRLEEEAYDYRYEVLKVSDDGVSEVDIMFNVNNSNGTGSGSLPYLLDGYDLISIVNRQNPEPNPRTLFFDMEKGVDFPHTYNAGPANQPFYWTRLSVYEGREKIEIRGKSFQACRVTYTISSDDPTPELRLVSDNTIWYAVGTGLQLKLESHFFPNSESSEKFVTKTLIAADINGEKIL